MPLLPPPDADALAHLVARALDEGSDDAELARLRALERAARALPPLFDGVRPVRLLHVDPLATTWEAWEARSGRRCLVRCLRPEDRDDPRLARRLARGLPAAEASPALAVGEARLDGDWPHVFLPLDGLPLADLLPAEEPGEAAFAAALLGRGLAALAALDRAGHPLRQGLSGLLHLTPAGPRLAWLGHRDPLAAAGPPPALLELAGLTAAFDEEGRTPAGRLALGWVAEAPPDLESAEALLLEELRSHLLSTRHHLASRARARAHQDRAGRLAGLVARLGRALPPPALRACLHASPRGPLTLVESREGVVRGGVRDRPDFDDLPVIYEPDGGLRAPAHRPLLRAWAVRRSGAPRRRQELQQELGADDLATEQLVRWLSATARLRAALGILRAEQRQPPPTARIGAVAGAAGALSPARR